MIDPSLTDFIILETLLPIMLINLYIYGYCLISKRLLNCNSLHNLMMMFEQKAL